MSDINLSNLQVPPTTTMSMHMDAVNPHPQYVRIDELSTAANVKVAVRHLQDVDDSIPTNNTILVYKGAKYSPVTMDEFRGILNIPYATTEEAGVIEVATNSDLGTLNNVAVTPALMEGYVADYVNIALNNFNIPPATDITIGGVTLNQISTITSNIVRASAYILPDATSEVKGGVYIATIPECVVGVDTSRAVTPAGLRTAITSAITSAMASTSGYVLPVATTDTLGGVKVVETDNPLGKTLIADLITSNHTNGGLITSYVPQIQYNQFVNVRVAEWLTDDSPDIYYSTHVGPIPGDDAAEALAATSAYKVGYNVYSNGVMSGRTKIGTTDYSMINITVHEQGAAYDINTKGTVVVLQEGIIKRLTVDKDCYATIQGEAHNVLVSTDAERVVTPMGGYGGLMEITNHGHATYCTITGYGAVRVGMYDTEGIIENVIVSNISTGYNNYHALYVSPTGKAFNVVLTGSYAGATIDGYAKDVVVHRGCVLWATADTTKIDNLILYNGAEVKLGPNTQVTGCIAYPGATMTGIGQATSVTFNTCHEPDHTIKPVYSTCQHYSKALVPVEIQPGITSNEIKLKNTYGEWYFSPTSARYDVPYRIAMLYGTSTYTQNITSSYDETVTSTGWRQMEDWKAIIYATTPPRCFVRSDADKITSMNAIDFTHPDDWHTYNTLSKGAVICYPVNIVNIGTPTAGGTIRYEVVPDFGPDAYHEAWVKSEGANPPVNTLTRQYLAETVSTDTNGGAVAVKMGNYGEFITSGNSLAFYRQIQSKMFEELTILDTSIVWKIAF